MPKQYHPLSEFDLLQPPPSLGMTTSRQGGATTPLIFREETIITRQKKNDFREKVKALQVAKMREAVLRHTSNFRDGDFVRARDGATSIGQVSFSMVLQKLREIKINKKNN